MRPIEREFAQCLGAQPFERTAQRRGVRNGQRRRQFSTRIGMLELRIPRDRAGRFQRSFFARFQRSEEALVTTLVELYLQGVSPRKVSTVIETLCGASVQPSKISALTKWLDREVDAWPTRLRGVQHVVSDQHAGLVDAILRFFPEAVRQRCQVHYLGNASDRVSREARRDAAKHGLQDVWRAPTPPLAELRALDELRAPALVAEWRATSPTLADWLEALNR